MLKKGIFIILSAILLSACNGSERAGVEILAQPSAKVFIDGKEAGMTPYRNKNLTPGFIVLKIVWSEENGKTWEQGLRLQPYTDAVIDVTLDKEMVNGYILGLEKISDKSKAGLMLASYPDNAVVSIDGQVVGNAPMRVADYGAGDKHLKLLLAGYKPLDIYAKLINGYELSLIGYLSRDSEKKPTEPTPSEVAPRPSIKMAVIKKTPLGFLRVRSEPGTTSKEIAKVKPAEEYEILLEQAEWLEIKLSDQLRGWVKKEFCDVMTRVVQ